MKIRFIISAFLLLALNVSRAQELPEITPLSPNAASIVKYGEIPVSHFTGVPQIEVPIFNINSGKLLLPLSLSYHAGGNKVESIASWVGLGWSLTSIPSISRNVRGIPDENNGYFSNYNGLTVKELWALKNQAGTGGTFDSYRAALYNGTADSEPDIFSYNLPEGSGKFFYNQEYNEFITYPKANVKIVRNGADFKIISANGNEYNFNVKETAGEGNYTTTTWFASTITSYTKKDSIRFVYKEESQTTKSLNVVNKYHHLSGYYNGSPSNASSILSINTIHAKTVDSIVFNNGYVKFNKNENDYRKDLDGGYSLNNISIYNYNHKLVKKYVFTYRYKQGTNSSGGACTSADNYSKQWMLLDKFEQISEDNSNDKLLYSFDYNENSFPACRYSAAQDYWGYYNGEETNLDLTPPYYIQPSSIQISGADRNINPSKSSFGILNKITYPTGGYTEFDFENNITNSSDLPEQYVQDYISIAGEEYFQADMIPDGTDSFEKTFNIDNPQNLFLNNNNLLGGANVEFNLSLPGCDLSQGSNTCAIFKISSTTNTNTYYLHETGTSFYLPNGTYKMTATFNQIPALYQDFVFIAKWYDLDSNPEGNTFAGGLRINEIRNYSNSSSQPITKKYKYTTEYDSTISSGDIFSIPNYSNEDIIEYINTGNGSSGGGSFGSYLLRIKSKSNRQQVTHSGSAVGYSNVFELSNGPENTGYTQYTFSNFRDEPETYGFPYPPSLSLEHERGKIMNISTYEKKIDSFNLKKKKQIHYSSLPFDNILSIPKTSFAIKWGNLIVNETTGASSTYYASNMVGYEINGGWYNKYNEMVYNYYDDTYNSESSNFYYDNSDHLLSTRIVETNSDGSVKTKKIKYAQDVSDFKLIASNRLEEPVKIENFKTVGQNEILRSSQITNFDDNHNSSDLYLPSSVQTSKGSYNFDTRIVFEKYDNLGNIKEVKIAEGTSIFYIWGYNSTSPIAKIENFEESQITTTIQSLITAAENASNLDDSSCLDSENCNEKNLRSALNTLRNSLPNSMVTTYTYDPLIGVTSVTDPRGYTTYYDYDDFGRLESVLDSEGNILSKNEYHYKNNL